MSAPSSIKDSALDVGRSTFSSPGPVELHADLWGTEPPSSILDSPSSQLPPSTFAPPPVDIAVLDYDTVAAEITRLELRIEKLKMQLTRP